MTGGYCYEKAQKWQRYELNANKIYSQKKQLADATFCFGVAISLAVYPF